MRSASATVCEAMEPQRAKVEAELSALRGEKVQSGMEDYMTKIILAAALALATGPAVAETLLIDLPFQAEFRIDEPFIEVYLRTAERLIACNSNASMVTVAPQLYSDFGYGVIDAAWEGMSGLEPFHRIRLQMDGDDTVVSLKTTVGTDMEGYPTPVLGWLEYWVRGGTACVQNGYHEPVPTL